MKQRVLIFIFCIINASFLSSEESVWERNLRIYIEDNYEKYVFYSKNNIFKGENVIYLMNLKNNNGVVFLFDGDAVCNSFEFYYDVNQAIFQLGDVHGGIWSINNARKILDNIFNMNFVIIQGKDILKKLTMESQE